MKRYGIILADNGSNWYISGVPDERWDNDTLVGELATAHGSDFEAVDETGYMIDPDTAAASCFALADHWAWLPFVDKDVLAASQDALVRQRKRYAVLVGRGMRRPHESRLLSAKGHS